MMKRRVNVAVLALAILMSQTMGRAAESLDPETLPPLAEVLELVREHLPQVDEAGLNHAAVLGLVEQLRPRVLLLPAYSETAPADPAELLSKAERYGNSVAYLRIAGVADGLSSTLRGAYEELKAKQPVQGVLLDLRFAGGQDYRAAAEAADLFMDWETVLLRWNDLVERSRTKNDAIGVPVVVLVNGQTSAAAEALAGMLRQNRAALVVGSRTAGEAHQYAEFRLSTGHRLKVASGLVDAGAASGLSSEGIAPDIAVSLSLEEEREFFENPYRGAEGTRTRRTVNESDLIRMKNGEEIEEGSREKPASVRDPALARGIDLLKGLAVLQRR